MQFYIFIRLFLVKTFKGPVGFPIIHKAVLQGKLKGAQCSEPVKSSWTGEKMLGARGHWALLGNSPDIDFTVYTLYAFL